MRDSTPATATVMPLDESMATISALAEQGGPDPHEYDMLWRACSGFGHARASGHISLDEHREFMTSLGPVGTPESLMGHIFHKPYGYAGDFEIIDKLYRIHVAAHPLIQKWDVFVQAIPCSQAVRNRGPFLLSRVRAMLHRTRNGASMRVVSIGSGPGRDIQHVLTHLHTEELARLRVTCIDLDDRALTYSRTVLMPFDDRVTYVNANALRLTLDEPADLIWSAGLFDYFADRTFIYVLKRLASCLALRGEIVIGNFSERCAGHGPMQFADWHLVVRSSAELLGLAALANMPTERCTVDAESTGLNLFLTVSS